MPRKLIHYFKPTLRGLGVLWVNISNVWDISGTVEKIYFVYALPRCSLPRGEGFWGENVKVTRPKHRFLKMYLENGVILSDETANVLAEAG